VRLCVVADLVPFGSSSLEDCFPAANLLTDYEEGGDNFGFMQDVENWRGPLGWAVIESECDRLFGELVVFPEAGPLIDGNGPAATGS